MKEREDLTGRQFGRWTVLKRAENRIKNNSQHIRYWLCRCQCGTEREVCEKNLISGISKSCGCARKEKQKMIYPVENLVGKTFGYLTVLCRGKDKLKKDGSHERYWTCKCECGQIKDVREYLLKNGFTKSCGCHRGDGAKRVKTKDLTGQVFGRLTVLYQAPCRKTSGGSSKVVWHCRCSCGNEVNVDARQLLSGDTKSCGCYNRDVARERMKNMDHYWNAQRNKIYSKKYCEYDLTSENYGIGWTSATHSKFIFDKEDYDKIKNYCWNLNDLEYICSHEEDTHKTLFMHRVILGLWTNDDKWKDLQVDHINHNVWDNRKINLRIVDCPQNVWNRKVNDVTSENHPGIDWDNNMNSWRVRIGYRGDRKDLGHFTSLQEAIKVREEAENKYYGEYRYSTSMLINKEE